jgi:hypothetical protein
MEELHQSQDWAKRKLLGNPQFRDTCVVISRKSSYDRWFSYHFDISSNIFTNSSVPSAVALHTPNCEVRRLESF